MARFDDAFKDEVRSRNDIVEVISSYLKLERRGNRFVGLCPFHGEKTPSFSVNPEMQMYHCFGCKRSGDVFAFVMEREQLTFFEALVQLAKRARIPLPQEERTPEEEEAYKERRATYDALEYAARFYHNQLMTEPGTAAKEYLTGRGLTEASMRRFRLGWAPGYGRLYRAMRNRFATEILIRAGLILPRRDGSGYMDAFFDRVIFPITDLSGRTLGFGGRILQGNAPKYKNTSETPLFSKRRVLFGLSQSLQAIRTQNQAILVEGYMDVIMPHQAGVENVVAPLGTALTDEQCAVLRQQAEQVIVAFDADTAGQLATLRGLEKLYDTGIDVRILSIPDGKDPDEYIREHGVDAFRQCISDAVPLIEFKLRRAMASDLGNSPETKARAVQSIARVLADLKNDVLREQYVHAVANELADSPVDVPELKQAIDRQMNRLLRQGFQNNQQDSRNNTRVPGPVEPAKPLPVPSRSPSSPSAEGVVTAADGLRKVERTLLFLTLQHPVLAERISARLGPQPFAEPVHAEIFRVAAPIGAEVGLTGGSILPRVLDRLTDEGARQVLAELAAHPLVSAHAEKEAEDCIENIKRHRDSRRIEDLEKRFEAARAEGKEADSAEVLEYMQLQQRLRKAPRS